MKDFSVGLVIPTLNAGEQWIDCLNAVKIQTCQPHRLLNIDSASKDATVDIAKTYGFASMNIERREFNHGGTRQLAVNLLDDCEIVVFLTQDAILDNRDSLRNIVESF